MRAIRPPISINITVLIKSVHISSHFIIQSSAADQNTALYYLSSEYNTYIDIYVLLNDTTALQERIQICRLSPHCSEAENDKTARNKFLEDSVSRSGCAALSLCTTSGLGGMKEETVITQIVLYNFLGVLE
jgi:hypothetical protein